MYDAGESADLGEKVLARGEAIAGTVVDAAGVPVAGAEVTLRAPTPGDADILPAPIRTSTGADGTFRLDGAAPTGNTLSVVREGLRAVRERERARGCARKPVVLSPGMTLAGAVKPLAGKERRRDARPAGTGAAETRWVEAAEDGRFTIPDAPAGKGTLVADAGDAGWGEARRG